MFHLILCLCLILNTSNGFDLDYTATRFEDTQHRRVEGRRSIGVTSVDYPFVVLINTDQNSCSGSIIHPKVVITAAHCLSKINISVDAPQYLTLDRSNVLVGVDSNVDRNVASHTVSIIEVQICPEYDVDLKCDIGMMRTNASMLEFGGRVLSLGKMKMASRGTHVKILGYEHHSPETSAFAYALRVGEIQTDDFAECKHNLNATYPIKWDSDESRYLCLVSYEANSLDSDSGGPVVHDGKLIGVISRSFSPNKSECDAHPEKIKSYIEAENIFYVMEWIQSYIDREECAPVEEGTIKPSIKEFDPKLILDKGNKTSVIYPVKDTMVVYPKGNTTVVHANGMETIVNPEGGAYSLSPEGNKTLILPGLSTVVIVHPDKSGTLINPDGSLVVLYADGRKTVVNPDGSSRYLGPKEAWSDPILDPYHVGELPPTVDGNVVPLAVNVFVNEVKSMHRNVYK